MLEISMDGNNCSFWEWKYCEMMERNNGESGEIEMKRLWAWIFCMNMQAILIIVLLIHWLCICFLLWSWFDNTICRFAAIDFTPFISFFDGVVDDITSKLRLLLLHLYLSLSFPSLWSILHWVSCLFRLTDTKSDSTLLS